MSHRFFGFGFGPIQSGLFLYEAFRSGHDLVWLLAEEDKPGPHVQALAQIATLFKVPGFIEKLIAANSPRELQDILVAEEERER